MPHFLGEMEFLETLRKASTKHKQEGPICGPFRLGTDLGQFFLVYGASRLPRPLVPKRLQKKNHERSVYPDRLVWGGGVGEAHPVPY